MTLSPEGTLAGTLVSLLDSSLPPLHGKVSLAPHIRPLSPFLSSLQGFPPEIQLSHAQPGFVWCLSNATSGFHGPLSLSLLCSS